MSQSPESGRLELAIARKRSDEYDEVVRMSNDGCDCKDFEVCLRVGIQYFDWIIASDERYRSALYNGKTAYDKEVEDALENLIRGWHRNGELVLKAAQQFSQLGFDVEGMAEFQRRFDEAAAIVESLDETDEDRIMSQPLIDLRDQAVLEHERGTTTEFI
jgi:hypothetical protein